MEINKIYQGDSLEVLKTLPNESINCIMTSPPYWALRDYGADGQLGLEPTFEGYINKLCDIFDEVKRVLRKDGTCWVNLGDTYNGSKSGKTDRKVSDYVKDTQNKLRKTRQDSKQLDTSSALRKRHCCECGIIFDASPNQYFCSSKCSGVDNTPRKNKGMLQDKTLLQIPSRFAIEMCNRGWILRNVIIWHKPNAMPNAVRDRFTVDFEYLFFFVKSKKYWFEQILEPIQTKNDRRLDSGRRQYKGKFSNNSQSESYNSPRTRTQRPNYQEAFVTISSKGRNKRTVWNISTKPFAEAHFAVYPEELCKIPIKAGCPEAGIVLDPFFGAGTTGLVALKQNKNFIGIELNPEYIKIAQERLRPYLEQEKLL